MTDHLTVLLQQFELRSRTYHNGPLCGTFHFDDQDGIAHLHLLRGGRLIVTGADGKRIELDEPTALFYPRPAKHGLHTALADSVDVVCAAIEVGRADNPVLASLPAVMVIPLARLPAFGATQALLFDEAFSRRSGYPIVVDRLTEVLMVQLLRYAIDHGLADEGLMAGLADPRLSKTLTALHANPARAWNLDSMADMAHMSRSRFAARFKEVMGTSPGDYLTQWRVCTAKGLLRKGAPVKQAAVQVGYADARSFGRAFAQVVGASPTAWLAVDVDSRDG